MLGQVAAGDGIQEEDDDVGIDTAANRFAKAKEAPPPKRRRSAGQVASEPVQVASPVTPPAEPDEPAAEVEPNPVCGPPAIEPTAIDELAVDEAAAEEPFEVPEEKKARLQASRRQLNLVSEEGIPPGCSLRMYPSRDDPNVGYWEAKLPSGVSVTDKLC